MICFHCHSEDKVKNGIIRELQRYKFKHCGKDYTFDYSYFAEKEKRRRFGLYVYLEGLGFHSIARLLNVSHLTVMNWVKKIWFWIEEDTQFQTCSDNGIRRTSYLCRFKKSYKWIWTAVYRTAREYIDFFWGTGGTETGIKLWESVKDYVKGFVMTDYWKSYKEMTPAAQLYKLKKRLIL